MKTKKLYFLWLGLYALCFGLGFIPERNLFAQILLGLLSLVFYIPPILLLHQGVREGDKKLLSQIRKISLASLVLTMLLIVANIASVYASDAAGRILNTLLNLVSVPMFCCYFRGMGLFLWACLFISSFPRLWKN